MQSLPLFPLNTVLFPGMPITLHIFEERYKLMINECVRGISRLALFCCKAAPKSKVWVKSPNRTILAAQP